MAPKHHASMLVCPESHYRACAAILTTGSIFRSVIPVQYRVVDARGWQARRQRQATYIADFLMRPAVHIVCSEMQLTWEALSSRPRYRIKPTGPSSTRGCGRCHQPVRGHRLFIPHRIRTLELQFCLKEIWTRPESFRRRY